MIPVLSGAGSQNWGGNWAATHNCSIKEKQQGSTQVAYSWFSCRRSRDSRSCEIISTYMMRIMAGWYQLKASQHPIFRPRRARTSLPPWKAVPPPHLCQADFQWHRQRGHHQVPRQVQEPWWQKAGACAAPAESNSLGVLKTKLPCRQLGMQMGIFLTSFPELHFMISKVELLHVQVNGIKISTLIFVKHLGTVAMNIKGEPRRKITIVCWVRFEWYVQVIHGAAQGTMRKIELANIHSFFEHPSSVHWRYREPVEK